LNFELGNFELGNFELGTHRFPGADPPGDDEERVRLDRWFRWTLPSQ
jgi:hypothetical protein